MGTKFNEKQRSAIAGQLKGRLNIVKDRYEKEDKRHVAILEMQNLIRQFSDFFGFDDADFNENEFLKSCGLEM